MLSTRAFLTNSTRIIPSLSSSRFGSTLIVAEHNEEKLAPITLNAITAANKVFIQNRNRKDSNLKHQFFLLF